MSISQRSLKFRFYHNGFWENFLKCPLKEAAMLRFNTYHLDLVSNNEHSNITLSWDVSSLMDFAFCLGCYKITTVFSHAQTVVVCAGCSAVLCQPTGGRARLTEGLFLLPTTLQKCVFKSIFYFYRMLFPQEATLRRNW